MDIQQFEVTDWSDRGSEIDEFVEDMLKTGMAYIQMATDSNNHEDYYMINTVVATSTRLPLRLVQRLINEGRLAPKLLN